MGRSQSSSTRFQEDSNILYHHLVDAEQIKGIYYGTVLQTDVSIALGAGSPIPTGTMTISIPNLGNNHVSDPIPYPSRVAPALGSQVAVGFDSRNNPIVLAIYGGVVGASGTVTLASLGLHTGSLTFVNGLITAFTAPA